MQETIYVHLFEALVPLGIVFVTIVSTTLTFLLKRIAARIEKHFEGLEIRDDVDDLVHAAEETLAGFAGSDRYKWVLERLQTKYPNVPVEKLDVLIQAAVSAAPGLGRRDKVQPENKEN